MLPKNRTAHIHLANRIAERKIEAGARAPDRREYKKQLFTVYRLAQPAPTRLEVCARLNSSTLPIRQLYHLSQQSRFVRVVI